MNEKILEIKKWLGTGSVNIFGLPMSGKDTQGIKLAEALGGVLIGGGEIMRGDNMSSRIKKAMKTGKLINTADYLSIIVPHLTKKEYQNKPLILNSIGRWSGEEDSIIAALTDSNHPLKIIVLLKLNNAEVFDRLTAANKNGGRGARGDDSEEKMKLRLQEFKNKTMPVIKSYQQLGVVVEVDANQTKDKVFEDIIDKLYSFANRA